MTRRQNAWLWPHMSEGAPKKGSLRGPTPDLLSEL